MTASFISFITEYTCWIKICFLPRYCDGIRRIQPLPWIPGWWELSTVIYIFPCINLWISELQQLFLYFLWPLLLLVSSSTILFLCTFVGKQQNVPPTWNLMYEIFQQLPRWFVAYPFLLCGSHTALKEQGLAIWLKMLPSHLIIVGFKMPRVFL